MQVRNKDNGNLQTMQVVKINDNSETDLIDLWMKIKHPFMNTIIDYFVKDSKVFLSSFFKLILF